MSAVSEPGTPTTQVSAARTEPVCIVDLDRLGPAALQFVGRRSSPGLPSGSRIVDHVITSRPGGTHAPAKDEISQ